MLPKNYKNRKSYEQQEEIKIPILNWGKKIIILHTTCKCDFIPNCPTVWKATSPVANCHAQINYIVFQGD